MSSRERCGKTETSDTSSSLEFSAAPFSDGNGMGKTVELTARVTASSNPAFQDAELRLMLSVEGRIDEAYRVSQQKEQDPVSVDHIKRVVADAFGIKKRALRRPGGSRSASFAQGVAMYIACERTDMSLPAIGDAFGWGDHAIVMFIRDQIKRRVETGDPRLLERVRWVLMQLALDGGADKRPKTSSA
jgi:hypothetical protein